MALLAAKNDAQVFRNATTNLILNGENIRQGAIKTVAGPYDAAVFGAYQAQTYANSVAALKDAALKDAIYSETSPCFKRVDFPAFKRKRRSAGNYLQVLDMCKFICDAVGKSIAKILILHIPRQVPEG